MRVSTFAVTLALLVGCREPTDYGPDIAALQDDVATLQTENIALADRVTALETENASQDTRITALEEEIVALSEVDLTDLQDTIDDHEARLTSVETAGYATEQWVLDQGYATDADLQTTNASVAANSTAIATNATNITANGSAISLATSSIAANALQIGQNQSDIAVHTVNIGTNQSNIGVNAGNISSNTTDIATNAADIATSAADIAVNAGDIATNATDIGTNAGAIASNATDIGTNSADIAANAAAIASVMDASLMGMYPALLEFSRPAYEAQYNQGHGGHLMVTSGGAFRYSGWISTSGFASDRAWFVTFYVTNPTNADVDVTWDFCRGDTVTLTVDATTVASGGDADGACTQAAAFTLTPGAHEIRIRYVDGNNWFEGLGVENAWILDHGLEIDWAGLNAALGSGIL